MSIVTLSKYLKDLKGKLAGSEFRKRRNKKIELSQKRVPTRPDTEKQKRHAKIYKKCLEKYYKLTEEEKRQYIEKYREFNLDAYRAFMKDCLRMPGIIREIPNCILELHFDEGSGTIAKDTSGSGYDGTIYGAVWTDGKLGKALYFDGVDDYVETGAIPTLTRCIELWVYRVGDGTGTHNPIAFKGYAPTGLNFEMRIHHAAIGYFTVSVITTAGENHWVSVYPLPKDQWHHAVLTYDDVYAKFYVNGNKVLEAVVNETQKSMPDYGAGIGGSKAAGIYFDGIIDEVRFYSRALNEEEIKDLYQYYPSCKPEMDGVVKVYDRDFRPYF